MIRAMFSFVQMRLSIMQYNVHYNTMMCNDVTPYCPFAEHGRADNETQHRQTGPVFNTITITVESTHTL